jgi:hypothetical protein
MKGMFAVVAFAVLTAVCWGVYGPIIQAGQAAMRSTPLNPVRLRPFICVGIAYFIIAIVVPIVLLRMRGELGNWSTTGVIWSTVAGGAGAIGALGIILAFSFGGRPIYVMPLVFGGAPVINAFTEIIVRGEYAHVGPLFYAGLILVVGGAVMVLVFAPRAHALPPPIPT